MNAIRKLVIWMSMRPILSALLAFGVGMSAGAIGVYDGMTGQHGPAIFYALGALGVIFTAAILRDMKKLTGLILVATLLPLPSKAEEEPKFEPAAGPVVLGVGLGLLIGGGYICYRLVDVCAKNKKKLQPPTPPPSTNNTNQARALGAVGNDGTSAGYICFHNDYCSNTQDFAPASEPPPQNGITMNVTIDDTFGFPEATITDLRHTPDSQLVTFDEFNRGLAAWGVQWTGYTGQQYAVNGRPATAADVPFRFDPSNLDSPVVLYPNRPQYRFQVEASEDFVNWRPILKASQPAGITVQVQDDTSMANRFYRVALLQ